MLSYPAAKRHSIFFVARKRNPYRRITLLTRRRVPRPQKPRLEPGQGVLLPMTALASALPGGRQSRGIFSS